MIIEAIDHHSVAVATSTRAVPANGRIYFTMPTSRDAEGMRVRIGDYSWDELSHGPGDGGVTLSTSGDATISEKDWEVLNK